MQQGVPFLKSRGLATDDDVALTEAEGCIADARPELVSDRALARGLIEKAAAQGLPQARQALVELDRAGVRPAPATAVR